MPGVKEVCPARLCGIAARAVGHVHGRKVVDKGVLARAARHKRAEGGLPAVLWRCRRRVLVEPEDVHVAGLCGGRCCGCGCSCGGGERDKEKRQEGETEGGSAGHGAQGEIGRD